MLLRRWLFGSLPGVRRADRELGLRKPGRGAARAKARGGRLCARRRESQCACVAQERARSEEGKGQSQQVFPLYLCPDHCAGQTNEAGPLLQGRSQVCGRKQEGRGEGAPRAAGAGEAQAARPASEPHRISPSSAALQNVLGHMGAVAMRFTRFVWSPNMWIVSFTVRSWTCTLESAAPVIKMRSPA